MADSLFTLAIRCHRSRSAITAKKHDRPQSNRTQFTLNPLTVINRSSAKMSAGGGGKSLELMQQRLKQQQQPPPTAAASQQPPTQEAPTQQQQSQQAQQVAPPKRAGKDFAAMAMSVKNVNAVPSPPQQSPQQTRSPGATASTAVGKPKGKDFSAMANRNEGGKPKGKDFGAMAARMAPPPVAQQQQQQPPSVQPPQQPSTTSQQQKQQQQQQQQQQQLSAPLNEADAARQRQIDAARRAAGYTPMSAQAANMQAVAAKKMKNQQGMQVPAQQVKKQQLQQQPQPRGPPGTQLRRSSSQTMKPPQQQNQQQIQQQQQAAIQMQYQQQVPQQPVQQQPVHQQQVQQQQVQPVQRPSHQQPPLQAMAAVQHHQPGPTPAAPKPLSLKPTPQPKSHEAKLFGGAAHTAPLVGQRLNDLLHSLDPNYSLDQQAEEEVLRLAQHFLDNVVAKSIRMTQHRGSKSLEVQDVQFVLAKQWGIVVPGLGPPTRPANRAPAVAKRKSETSTTSASNTGGPVVKKAKVGA